MVRYHAHSLTHKLYQERGNQLIKANRVQSYVYWNHEHAERLMALVGSYLLYRVCFTLLMYGTPREIVVTID